MLSETLLQRYLDALPFPFGFLWTWNNLPYWRRHYTKRYKFTCDRTVYNQLVLSEWGADHFLELSTRSILTIYKTHFAQIIRYFGALSNMLADLQWHQQLDIPWRSISSQDTTIANIFAKSMHWFVSSKGPAFIKPAVVKHCANILVQTLICSTDRYSRELYQIL